MIAAQLEYIYVNTVLAGTVSDTSTTLGKFNAIKVEMLGRHLPVWPEI